MEVGQPVAISSFSGPSTEDCFRQFETLCTDNLTSQMDYLRKGGEDMNKSTAAEEKIKAEEGDGPVRHEHSVLIYTQPTKPVLVEAQNFQTLVQSLTGGKRRKRKRVSFKEDVAAAVEDSVLEQRAAKIQVQTLLDYLDRLDQECPPPSRASGNRGFFPTAGLVKGVSMEEGLQAHDCPDSPWSPLSPSGIKVRPRDELQVPQTEVHSLGTLPKLVCTTPEWAGCLSPRSKEVMRQAQRTALLAAGGDRSGSGPWNICLDKIADVDRDSMEDDERDLPVDVLFYKAEITIVGTHGTG